MLVVRLDYSLHIRLIPISFYLCPPFVALLLLRCQSNQIVFTFPASLLLLHLTAWRCPRHMSPPAPRASPLRASSSCLKLWLLLVYFTSCLMLWLLLIMHSSTCLMLWLLLLVHSTSCLMSWLLLLVHSTSC